MRAGMDRWGCTRRMSLHLMGWACRVGCLIRVQPCSSNRDSKDNSSNRAGMPRTPSFRDTNRGRCRVSNLNWGWRPVVKVVTGGWVREGV